ncbi:hypothetical protein FDZ71_05455 [bacterium]|nr:MAG: hypothetical protein FDZ71_05455 [bacterium]
MGLPTFLEGEIEFMSVFKALGSSWGEFKRVAGENKKGFLTSLAIIAVVLLVIVFGGWQYMNSSSFCGSCHNMDPYYKNWSESSHKSVKCVDCHLPPGTWNHIKYKMIDGAISGVFFVTGKGPSKASAHVPEASCLYCHNDPKKLDEKGPKKFAGGDFEHSTHLGNLDYGINLECTACHGATTQEKHLEVTPEACVQCHHSIKETGQCSNCHKPRKEVTVAGVAFEHATAKKACRSCHSNIGSPQRPTDACIRCHGQKEALEAEKTAENMHKVHVSDRHIPHKVECFDCHGVMLPLKKKAVDPAFVHKYHLTKASQSCTDCHSGKNVPACSDCH